VFWFDRIMPRSIPGLTGESRGEISENRWNCVEKKIKCVKPLLEYLNIKWKKEDFTVSKDENGFLLEKDIIWDGVAVRCKGFSVSVSKIDGKINSFTNLPPVKPGNNTPNERYTEEEIKEIARK
ncbi:MAG: hypothetical protein ACP5QY_13865, partial [Candidatus Hydrogenedens sp.]